MNDEIREIKIITLDDIFKNIETEDKAFMFLKYIKGLQNHITNLQKENEELKEDKKKAVEYIKKHIQKYDIDGSIGDFDEFDMLTKPNYLLNILQKWK